MRAWGVALLLVVAIPAWAGPEVGSCMDALPFRKRQEALDRKVVELGAASASARKRLASVLASSADKDIECLIRYREPHMAEVFAEVLRTSRKWHVRARAAYGIKMTGNADAVPALAAALDDPDAAVREAAASALGHIGGDAAKEALSKRRAAEPDPYVNATLDSAIELAGLIEKPYGHPGTAEQFEGPPGAQRVLYISSAPDDFRIDRCDAAAADIPIAERFVYPVLRYKEDILPKKPFGGKPAHAGEDCAWFREGCSIYAVADGVVRIAQRTGGSFGALVVIEHRVPGGRYLTSVYGHTAGDFLVSPGQAVRCGQRIATLGLSRSAESGAEGANLHFGLGDGPARRPPGFYPGFPISWNFGGGGMKQTPVVRLIYSASKTGSRGWPLIAMVLATPEGGEVAIDVPEQPLEREIEWIHPWAKEGRGWLDPAKVMPELVEGKKAK